MNITEKAYDGLQSAYNFLTHLDRLRSTSEFINLHHLKSQHASAYEGAAKALKVFRDFLSLANLQTNTLMNCSYVSLFGVSLALVAIVKLSWPQKKTDSSEMVKEQNKIKLMLGFIGVIGAAIAITSTYFTLKAGHKIQSFLNQESPLEG